MPSADERSANRRPDDRRYENIRPGERRSRDKRTEEYRPGDNRSEERRLEYRNSEGWKSENWIGESQRQEGSDRERHELDSRKPEATISCTRQEVLPSQNLEPEVCPYEEYLGYLATSNRFKNESESDSYYMEKLKIRHAACKKEEHLKQNVQGEEHTKQKGQKQICSHRSKVFGEPSTEKYARGSLTSQDEVKIASSKISEPDKGSRGKVEGSTRQRSLETEFDQRSNKTLEELADQALKGSKTDINSGAGKRESDNKDSKDDQHSVEGRGSDKYGVEGRASIKYGLEDRKSNNKDKKYEGSLEKTSDQMIKQEPQYPFTKQEPEYYPPKLEDNIKRETIKSNKGSQLEGSEVKIKEEKPSLLGSADKNKINKENESIKNGDYMMSTVGSGMGAELTTEAKRITEDESIGNKHGKIEKEEDEIKRRSSKMNKLQRELSKSTGYSEVQAMSRLNLSGDIEMEKSEFGEDQEFNIKMEKCEFGEDRKLLESKPLCEEFKDEVCMSAPDDIKEHPFCFQCSFKTAPKCCNFQQIICYPNSEPVIVNEYPKCDKDSTENNDGTSSYTGLCNTIVNGKTVKGNTKRNVTEKKGREKTCYKKHDASNDCKLNAGNLNKSSFDCFSFRGLPNSENFESIANCKCNMEDLNKKCNAEEEKSPELSNSLANCDCLHNEGDKMDKTKMKRHSGVYNILSKMKTILSEKLCDVIKKFYTTNEIDNYKCQMEGHENMLRKIKVIDVIALGKRCMLIHWQILDNYGVLGYEISIDGCPVSSINSSNCVSEIVCGFNTDNEHLICVTATSNSRCSKVKTYCGNLSKNGENIFGSSYFYAYEPTKCKI